MSDLFKRMPDAVFYYNQFVSKQVYLNIGSILYNVLQGSDEKFDMKS